MRQRFTLTTAMLTGHKVTNLAEIAKKSSISATVLERATALYISSPGSLDNNRESYNERANKKTKRDNTVL